MKFLLLFTALVGVAVSALFLVSLWPYVHIIGCLLLGLLGTTCLYITARYYLDLRHRYLRLGVIETTCHTIDVREWRALPMQELPLLQVREEDTEEIQRSKVLTAYLEEGKGMHKIEKELGISYQKVRSWCNEADKLRSKPGQTDQ